jgi:hypothetical protein
MVVLLYKLSLGGSLDSCGNVELFLVKNWNAVFIVDASSSVLEKIRKLVYETYNSNPLL